MKGSDVFDRLWCRPVANSCEFDRVHLRQALLQDESKVIDAGYMERTSVAAATQADPS
jgi:hypothetical protein